MSWLLNNFSSWAPWQKNAGQCWECALSFLGVDTEPASYILLQLLLEVRQDTNDQGRTSLMYPGCQRLFMRGFRFRSSLKIKSSLAASPLVSLAEGRRRVGLRPTKLHVTREKKSLVPRVSLTWILCQKMLLKEVKKQSAKKCLLKQCLFENSYPYLRPTVGLVGKSAELYGTFYI